MKNYTIYLIRHGICEHAEEGRYIGHTDVSLSEDGIAQLQELVSDYVYPDVDAVFSSPLKRCIDTSKIIYPDKSPIIIEDLIEYDFGDWENKTAEDLKDNELFSKWLAGEKNIEPPFGESNSAFGKRVCDTFEKICEGIMKTSTFNTAIVTHGGVMNIILAAYGLPQLPMHEWMTGNGCGFTLKLDPSLWMRGKKIEVFSEFPYERED